jgi:hypothetical protein
MPALRRREFVSEIPARSPERQRLASSRRGRAVQMLDDVVCVGTGEVRTQAGATELVLDVMELVWQPIPE